jgi:hypothetical protein
MKTILTLVLKVCTLVFLIQHAFVLAQPLELVTLSDKGGLLPPEEKSVKDEVSKAALPKTSNTAKKSSVLPSSDKNNSAAGVNASNRLTYVVKAGDTLDKVVAMNFSDSIVKSEVLKKELVSMNPSAFTKGNPKLLLTGAKLKLPSIEQLMAKSGNSSSMTWSGEKANLMLSGYTSYPPVYVNAESSEKRRHWVQYP